MHKRRLIAVFLKNTNALGNVETLFAWGKNRLHHVIANLIRKVCTKLCQNRPRFVKDMTKTFWCVFRFTAPTVVHLQHHIIQVKWKTFTFLYDKFTGDNMYQILSQSVTFCRLYIKKHLGVFSVHSVYMEWLEANNLTFGRWIDYEEYYRKCEIKLSSVCMSRDLVLNFVTPYIFGIVKSRDF